MNDEYKICTKLVVDTSYPGIRFDAEGVSNHYADFRENVKPHWNPGAEGRKRLEQIVAEIKRSRGSKDFDCILGLSGGVDSSYMLHLLVAEYGLRPLVFHVDGGWNSKLAVHNIHVLIEKLGLDLYTEVINWDEMRDFQHAMFKAGVPHIDLPQDHAFISVLYRFARKYKIDYIFNGGNIATECVLTPLKYFYWGTDLRQINDILGRFGTMELKTYPFSSIFYHKVYLRYLRGLKVIKALNYVPYTLAGAIETLSRNYGWRPYPQKHFESRFTRFYEGYWLPTRFNFDIRRVQFSSLILSGQMTRDEALRRLESPPIDQAAVDQEFAYVASKLEITAEQLRGYHELPKKYYWDYANQQWVFELGEKVLSLFSTTRRGGAF